MPPFVETIGPPPLVAPTAPFAANLGAGNPPPPVLRQLAHERTLDAPAGIVLGLVRPVTASRGNTGHGLKLAPRAARRGSEHEEPERDGASDSGGDGFAEPTPNRAGEAPRTPTVTAATVRRAPVVGGEALPPPPRVRMTEAGPALAFAIPRGIVAPPLRAGTYRAPLVAPGSARPAPEPSGRTAEPPAAKSAFSADATRLTLGQARRLGLGAPISSGPLATGPRLTVRSSSAPQRARPDNAGAEPATQVSSAVAREPVAPTAATPTNIALDLARSGANAARTAAAEIVAPARATAEAGAAALPVARQPAVARPVQRAAKTAPGPAMAVLPEARATPRTVPLLGARPLPTRVQRAPLTTSARDRTAQPEETESRTPRSSIDGPVRIHRGSDTSDTAAALQARAFTHQGEVYLPAHHGPLDSPGARSLLAHEVTHVAQQRLLGSNLPNEDSPAGRDLEVQAVAAERGRAMPLALAPGSSASAAERADTGAGQPSPQRSGIESETSTVQLSTIELPGAQRAQMSSPSSPPRTNTTGTTPSEQELEELARQLYGRLRTRLRRELLADRERVGAVVDFR